MKNRTSNKTCLFCSSDRTIIEHKSEHIGVIIQWLCNVCNDFSYSKQTFIISVMIFVNYLENSSLCIHEYQLVGITSLCIAAKLEESKMMEMSSYYIITDRSCPIKFILKMEIEIIQTIDGNWMADLAKLRSINDGWKLYLNECFFRLGIKKSILDSLFSMFMQLNGNQNEYEFEGDC